MRFSTRAVVCAIVGLGVVSGSPVIRAQDAASVQTQSAKDKIFAELPRRDRKQISYAVSHFMQEKTPVAQVLPRVLPLLKIQANDYNDNDILSSLSALLGFYGPEAKSAIPSLITIAAEADQIWARERARNALVKIGSNDERVFEALLSTLRAPRHPGDAVNSAQALAQMGPIAQRAIPDLNNQIRALEKVRAYQYFGVSAAHRLYYALGEIALKNATLPSLDEAMKTLRQVEQITPDESILAFLSLQKEGRSASTAIPLLLNLVARNEEYSQGAAIDTLGFIGPGANLRVTQTLLDILDGGLRGLQDDDLYQTFLSRSAASALRKVTPEDAAGVPALANALKSPKKLVRITAAAALARIGEASTPAAANLSVALRATDKNTGDDEWQQYIRLAIAIGKDEGGLVDAILEVLDSPETLSGGGYVHERARANLWIALADIIEKSGEQIKIAKRHAIATRVLQTLQFSMQGERPDSLLFIGAARAAGALGEAGKDAVPILMAAIQSDKWRSSPIVESDGMIFHGYVSDTSVGLEAIRALGRIGKPAASALPLLQKLTELIEEDNKWRGTFPKTSDVAREAIKRINAAA